MATTWIITTRNPRTRKLLLIGADTDSGFEVSEFTTEDAARAVADNSRLCAAWGYEVIEVP